MTIELSKMSAADLDALIVEIAKVRARKEPLPPAQAPKVNEAIVNPAWYTAPINEATLFQVRHPGLGWMSFIIPPVERGQLMSYFLQQALLAPLAMMAAQKQSQEGPPPSSPSSGSGGTLH